MPGKRSDLPERIMEVFEAEARGAPRTPSIREIGAAVDVRSTSVITYHLRKLAEHGLLTHVPGEAHGWRLARQPGIRVFGTIAAGRPITSAAPSEPETLDLGLHTRSTSPEDQEFALLVRGDSMIEDRIFDGDYVIVRPGAAAPDGAIVVAVHMHADGSEGAATVKRLQRQVRLREVWLEPANSAMEPIRIPAAEWDRSWRIQGVVTALYRPTFPTPRRGPRSAAR
jgi:repressor LexA